MRTSLESKRLDNPDKISEELERLKTMLKENEKKIPENVFEQIKLQLLESEKSLIYTITFAKFKEKNKLFYDETNKKWNKEFLPIVKMKWIKKKKNWNKMLKKHGHWENYQDGWEIKNIREKCCIFCNKFLSPKQSRFCKDLHKKLFHKYTNEAKHKLNFKIGIDKILIPHLFEQSIDKLGTVLETPTNLERIEKKNIIFLINGKQYKLTKKSRTP